MMVEPGNNLHVLLAMPGNSDGPSFYMNHGCGLKPEDTEVADGWQCNTPERHCSEGSFAIGDFTSFTTTPGATWWTYWSPPTCWGDITPSGNVYLGLQPVGSSYLLFFSDLSHVHVSAGQPTRFGWHRIEGPDATPTAAPTPFNPYCNHPYVHVDPHAIAFTSSLFMTLEPPPASPSAPYNEHTVQGTSRIEATGP